MGTSRHQSSRYGCAASRISTVQRMSDFVLRPFGPKCGGTAKASLSEINRRRLCCRNLVPYRVMTAGKPHHLQDATGVYIVFIIDSRAMDQERRQRQ